MISVIVPVYNGEKTLPACIRSVLNQTEHNWELLLIDDGSTDSTPKLCRKAAARDSRIRCVSQKNQGVSMARNRGLTLAKGEFVTFLDADDLLPPAALETLQGAMEENVDFVIGSYRYFRLFWRRDKILSGQDRVDALMSLMCGKLYRRDILHTNRIRFRDAFPYGEDTVFNLQYGSCAAKWKVLPQVICHCRMGGRASSLRYYPNRDEIARNLLESYALYARTEELTAIAEQEWKETCLHYFVHCTKTEAFARTGAAWKQLAPFLPETAASPQSLWQRHRKRIFLRKMKRWFRRKQL